VEKTNQSTAPREAVDRASDAAQPVARGVDYQQRCMLPCGDGTAGHPVSIEGGAGVAAWSLLNERRVPLLVSASRRPTRIVATYSGCLESGACQLQRRGTSAGARQAKQRPQVRRGIARAQRPPIFRSPRRAAERLSRHFSRRNRVTARTASQFGTSKPRLVSLGWRGVCRPRRDWG